MTELHLACAADAPYVAHSAAMLHSALDHGGAPLVVHYLHGPSFPEADLSQLSGMFSSGSSQILFHEIPDVWLQGLPVQHRFGSAMWYRLFLPELLPGVARVLYLDVDTLVLDQLDPLWQVELEGHDLAAVTNVFMEYHRHRANELGIELFHYFNSGVLMFNLEQMRSDGFAESVLNLARTRAADLEWPDQDALNLVAAGNRVSLHPRWNVMNSFTSRPALAGEVFGEVPLSEALMDPAIRHFEGPGINKPWHALHDRRGRELYRTHRRATPWPRVKLEDNTPLNRLRRLASEARNVGQRRLIEAERR